MNGNDMVGKEIRTGVAALYMSLFVFWVPMAADGQEHEGHDHAEPAPPADVADDHEDHEAEVHDADDHGVEEGAHAEHAEDHEAEIHDADDHGVEEGAHAEHAEEAGLKLTPEQRSRFGIVTAVVRPGVIHSELRLSGEVVFNEDHVVHLVPQVGGVVREVKVTVGDAVLAGDVLAVLDSRELADAKAEFMAAEAREKLATRTFERERSLVEKRVSSEQDLLAAQQVLAEAGIERRSAQQKLLALGLSSESLKALADEPEDAVITRHVISSPIDGVVTEKHIVLGESLEATAHIFTIANTERVWANLTVYSRDLALVKRGTPVVIQADGRDSQATTTVAMVTPFVDPTTRSATARVVLVNGEGDWIPGTFVSGLITSSEEKAAVVVSQKAVQRIENEDVVFVEHEGNFEPVPVRMGRRDSSNVEIIAGLEAGQIYVTDGAFELKATMVTSNLDPHAGHGH